jgi:hypothetical protein
MLFKDPLLTDAAAHSPKKLLQLPDELKYPAKDPMKLLYFPDEPIVPAPALSPK